MKNLSKKNKIIIGVGVVIAFAVVSLVILFATKKNKDVYEDKRGNDVKAMLSSASKLEVAIGEDKKIELTNLEDLNLENKVQLWVFSEPVYLGEFLVEYNDGKYYIGGMEEELKDKNIITGNHQILVLQDDKTIGYFNIVLSDGAILSNEESDANDTLVDNDTTNKDNETKESNTDKTTDNVENKDNQTVKEETNTTKEIEVFEDIKYSTEEIKETKMLKGKKETVETGENGQKKITYKVIYDKNNKEIKREKIAEVVVKNVKNAKVKVGLSDYNLNDKPLYGLRTGLFCLDAEAKERNYQECDDVASSSNEYQSIEIGNKEYLICLNDNDCYDYYDPQFKLANYPNVSKYQGMYTATLNGTKYYLDMRAGSDGHELTEEVCTKIGLVCNRW